MNDNNLMKVPAWILLNSVFPMNGPIKKKKRKHPVPRRKQEAAILQI